jgi:hypothetical protein
MENRTLGRREFVRLAAASGLLHIAAVRAGAAAIGDGELRIVVVLSPGDAALLGSRLGAREAGHAARLFRTDFSVFEAAGRGGAAAAALLEQHRPQALIGGATPRDADALMRLAVERDVLFMNVGVPREALRQPCNARSFHLRPANAMRLAALAAAEGSTTAARALSWHPSLRRFGAAQVIDRFEDAFGVPMTEGAWEGWLAVKILFDASRRTDTTEPGALARFLTSERAAFDGHKGVQLSFQPGTHQLRQPLYIADGSRVLAEVPDTRDAGDHTHAELLDAIIPVVGGDTCAGR